MLERLFMARIRPHVENCCNFNQYQSAYRRGHSTETTLLRMLDDVYNAADNHSRSLLLQLDLSAAFDTLDKPTLLRRLDQTFGVRGTSWKWVDSYLKERSQYVRVGDTVSSSVGCYYGVPQGSVLGPLLFTIYTSPIANVIAPFSNVHHAQYADDTQLYIALNSDRAFTVINDCFQSVHRWLDANGLCLNPDKSEAIVIGTSARQRSELKIKDVTIAGVPVPVTRTVKSLGVTVDNTLSFDDHVNNVCKAAHFHIRALRHIRRCVSVDDAKTVATAMVSSRLDYCNSILYGTSSSNLNKLQRVQNALARTVLMTRKRDHITPVLANLHWLPVTARIQFKIALLTFKTLTTHQPSYIDDLLQQHRSSRQLRSSAHNLLEIPRMRTGFAQRSFTYSAPHIWNTLPRDITGNLNVSTNTFKKKLKTFYYTASYA